MAARVRPGDRRATVAVSDAADGLAPASSAPATTRAPAPASAPVQSADQSASTGQSATAESQAQQVAPKNENIAVRVLSPGNDGNVTQTNNAASSSSATNTAPVTQTASQAPGGSQSCGCSGGHTVDSIGQESSIGQDALAASGAVQLAPANDNAPVRIGSDGGSGSVTQTNNAASSSSAANTAPVTQTGTQVGAGVCGCYGTGVQALAQQNHTYQDANALSLALQAGASNASDPVRIGSAGNDGDVTQSNNAASSGSATNVAPTTQVASQTGSGIQALAQDASTRQQADAASAALQLAGESRCGCGGSGGNTAAPVRISSDGDGGSLTQSNTAASSATGKNTATTAQAGSQQQSAAPCGCSGHSVQALGQQAATEQWALGLSSAFQLAPANTFAPVRIWSLGGGGSTAQANGAASSGTGANTAATAQRGAQIA